MCHYDLSSQNRIISVSEDLWSGQGATFWSGVRGHVIWDYVAGLDTRSYLNALFFATRRSGAELAVRYRCDTEGERRLFDMRLVPLEDDGLRISHHAVERLPALQHRRREEVAAAVTCCSQCLSWRIGSQWHDLAAAGAGCAAKVDYVVCPTCRHAAQKVIERHFCLGPLH